MKETKVFPDIRKMQSYLKDTFKDCFDVVMRQLTDINGRKVIVMFIDGLVDKESIQDNVISPFLGFALHVSELKIKNIDDISKRLLTPVDIKAKENLLEIIQNFLSGDTAVFIDGSKEALIIQTRKWPSRSISEPDTQQNVRAPKEGFTETLLFNVVMLRRKIKNPRLKTEIIKIGELTNTDVCLVYIDGLTPPKLIADLRQRLHKLNVKYIMESGHIEQLIEDSHMTLFSTTGVNEKPDVVAGKLLKGRAAIIVDGTPYVLTAPMLFVENFQSASDYYSRPVYANFLRVLRFLAYFIALCLPAFYVALVTYHHEMIPDKLLNTLTLASEGVPIPTALEMGIMLILYEFLREAMLRLPAPIGGSVGIVGVLIIGEAAVGVNLIGAPTVVVAALTFIASALVSPLNSSSVILRFALLILGAAAGAFGVFIGLFLLLIHLCTLTSYNHPYMLPLAPVCFKGLKDSLLRLNIKDLLGKDGAR